MRTPRPEHHTLFAAPAPGPCCCLAQAFVVSTLFWREDKGTVEDGNLFFGVGPRFLRQACAMQLELNPAWPPAVLVAGGHWFQQCWCAMAHGMRR